MKEINQIIHVTKNIDTLKSILKNGFYTSYAKEKFGDKNILIPMISFSNILFRDIGEDEVVNYGNYGVVFNRDYIIEKFNLNPVFYVKNVSELNDIFLDNFQTSIIPQTLQIAKKFYVDCKCERFSEHIKINPITEEIKSLIDSLDENVNDEFIHSLKIIFENYYINTLKQALLLKPYKVVTKNEETKIAYNEREWRKSFFDLNFIYEIKPDGTKNEEYIQWNKKNKPHYTEKYIQSFDLSDVISIYVNEDAEIIEMEKFITENFNEKIEIYTLQQLKEIENKKISANNYHFSKT
jgi:hypothetical protein